MRERDKPVCYLVMFRLAETDQALKSRLMEHVPIINEVMESVSVEGSRPLLAFRSETGQMFGYFVKSKLPAYGVISRIDAPGTMKKPLASPTQRDDQISVMELGWDFESIGGARQKDWMTKNAPRFMFS